MPNNRALILHIENDADDVFLMQRAFKKAGHLNPVASVENGEQGVAYLTGNGRFANRDDYPLPAVILLDWNMPLMSGADFLRWIRGQATLKRLPVVVLTSSNNDADMHEAYELGANGFIVKPRSNDAFQLMALAFTSYWLQWNRSDALASSDPM